MAPSSWVDNYHHVFILGSIYHCCFNHFADPFRLNAAAAAPSVGTSRRELTHIPKSIRWCTCRWRCYQHASLRCGTATPAGDLRGWQTFALPPFATSTTTSYRGRLDVLGEGEKVTPAKIQLEVGGGGGPDVVPCTCVCMEWKCASPSIFHVRPLPARYQTAGLHHLLQHQHCVCVCEWRLLRRAGLSQSDP